MKGSALLFALGACFLPAAPLRVASVDRLGLPPYEDDKRIYRLEGPECGTLRVGETLTLRRQGEPRRLGKLEILSVHPDHVDARLAEAGETFPLKGDEALRKEPLQAMPATRPGRPASFPAPDALGLRPPRPADVRLMARKEPLPPLPPMAPAALHALPALDALRPGRPGLVACREPLLALPGIDGARPGTFPAVGALRPLDVTPPFPRPAATAAGGQGQPHRAPIFFIKENASLSPGAYDKLRLWVSTWGVEGRWSLECPKGVDKLSSLRLSALRSELQRLGVPSLGLDIRSLPDDPGARYDAIYIKKEP